MQSADRTRLLADVEGFCQELREHEELCYVEHRFNHHLVPLALKYNVLGLPVPVDYGGRGADAVTYARALARIGQEGTGVRTFFSGHTSIGQYPIFTWGTDAQKRKYLPPMCRGEKIGAFGLTEPDAGSNPLEMTTTYELKGDHYVLSGVKYLISNAGIANYIVTFAYPKVKPREAGGRVSAFIIDADLPGCHREDLVAKMGMPTANTGMFELVDFETPKDSMLGPEGDGFHIAMGTLVSGRLSVAAGCLGVIEDCLIESVRYAKERAQHGKAIGKHQLVQEHLAAIEMHRLTTDAIVYQAAVAKDAATDDAAKAKADLLAAQAKLHASNAAWDAADRAVQIFGGRGWSTLYRPGRHLQDVRVCRIYEGTDEILKLKIAAALLGKEYEAFK